ncbi:MAG: helix-turn-helix domain-containing protein [Planctomycetes bacterium]|nr:helix-turn-helix domain-containing protein [Planctomycetota bacterium]
MPTATTRLQEPESSYYRLVRTLPLRPIRSAHELRRALEALDVLHAKQRRGKDEEDYLNILSDIVAKYEEKHFAIPSASDAEILRYLIAEKGVSQSEVALATGIAISTISQVVGGKRTIPRFKIGPLAKYFHVSPSVFTFDKT